MEITNLSLDRAILRELGKRLAHLRKQHGYTQTHFSREAGIGVATLRRIESGNDGQMESWLKIMKVLGVVGNIDHIIPPITLSPMEEAKGKQGLRKTRPRRAKIEWGDEKF